MAIGSVQKNVGEKKVYTPLVEGQYSATLQRIKEVPTKKGDGMYLDATFEVAEGENKGRLLFHKFLIDHPSEKAVEIGKEQLDRFLQAAGVNGGLEGIGFDMSADTLSEFADKLVVTNVKIEPGTNGYPDRNKITSFSVR